MDENSNELILNKFNTSDTPNCTIDVVEEIIAVRRDEEKKKKFGKGYILTIKILLIFMKIVIKMLY